ncbi:hypothetical protein C5F48_24510, partial [Cereibacter changlensis JA139]
TASFGVESIGEAGPSVESWLAAADRRLYEAKAAGRNRCLADRQGSSGDVTRAHIKAWRRPLPAALVALS